jgi:hypothetical protein
MRVTGTIQCLFQVSNLLSFLSHINNLFLAVNTFSNVILMDYACLDNVRTVYLVDSPHRIYLNYTQIADNLYSLYDDDSFSTTFYIGDVVKRHNDQRNTFKLTSFRHLLKWPKAVPQLLRVLKAGGVWTTDLEPGLAALFRCRIEEVNSNVLFFNIK